MTRALLLVDGDTMNIFDRITEFITEFHDWHDSRHDARPQHERDQDWHDCARCGEPTHGREVCPGCAAIAETAKP